MNLKLGMTTREIATLTNKRHDNVVRDFERMLANGVEPKFEAVDFLDSYVDRKGENRKMYRLTKDLAMTLITGYDVRRRYAVIRRWRELEESAVNRSYTVEEVLQLNQTLIERYRTGVTAIQ